MKIPVILTIRSEQRFERQEPDVIELVTEGVMESLDEDVWQIDYAESALTGLEGVTTTFLIESERVSLDRTGALQSHMLFEENSKHDSLYQMDFGTLMIGICARRINKQLSEHGGFLEIFYDILIEQNQAGTVLYRVDIEVKN